MNLAVYGCLVVVVVVVAAVVVVVVVDLVAVSYTHLKKGK